MLLGSAATREIPVPEGIDTSGFTRRPIPSAVHELPQVSVLLVSDGSTEALIVACDGLAFRPRQAALTRQRVAAAVGLPASSVMLACSHSHALPTLDASWKIGGLQDEWTDLNERYLENFHTALEDAAKTARTTLRPVRMGIGTGESDIVVNRRMRLPSGEMILGINPDGYVDRTVTVVRIDGEDGSSVATLVNFGCHPTTVGPGATVVSPDYPAAMRRILTEVTDAPVLFLQGAVGDVGVRETSGGGDPAVADWLGRMLGHEAAKVWEGIETRNVHTSYELIHSFNTVQEVTKEVLPDPPGQVGVASAEVAIPLHEVPAADAMEQVLEEAEKEIEDAAGPMDPTASAARIRRRWAHVVLDEIKAGTADRVLAEIQVVTVNGIAFIALPVEPFSKTAQILRDRIGPNAICVGVANGACGYMPLPENFAEGGYEVTGALRTWALPGSLSPEAPVVILDEAVALATASATTVAEVQAR